MIGLYHTMTQHPHPRKSSTSGSKMKNNVTQKTPIDHQRLHEYPSTVILAEFLTYLIIKRSNKVKKIRLIFCLCQANICFICKYIRANTGIIRFIRIRANIIRLQPYDGRIPPIIKGLLAIYVEQDWTVGSL